MKLKNVNKFAFARKLANVGIVGYGAYIPRFRVKIAEIAENWNKNPKDAVCSLKVSEKSVPNFDEDTITMSVEATLNALKRAQIKPDEIGAIYVGSESHPYAVKPSSTVVGEAIGNNNEYFAADTEFACKAGTAAMQMVGGLVKSKIIDFGLAVGADTSQGAPGDPLEYTAAAAAAAFILGNKKEELLATVDAFYSYSSDTPDFWRRNNAHYPTHGGRFTGEPAYFKHVQSCVEQFFEKNKMKITDFDHVVFHMPNGKFPLAVAKKLGVSDKQMQYGFIVTEVGNPYSASSMLGLTNILDNAKKDEKILLTSYGSGAGADSFAFTTTGLLEKRQKLARTTAFYIKNKEYISYFTYLKLKGKLIL